MTNEKVWYSPRSGWEVHKSPPEALKTDSRNDVFDYANWFGIRKCYSDTFLVSKMRGVLGRFPTSFPALAFCDSELPRGLGT